ncbi:MAG: hypothetical protein L0Y73_03900 [Candidatus Aminicenantes bacterium]|nr:hypothetical protein [Candidatus Aminicenantes bacterium]
MLEEKINELKKMIVKEAGRFINCFSANFSLEDKEALDRFLVRLKEEYKDLCYLDVDIRLFDRCKDEEQEANILLNLLDKESKDRGLGGVQLKAISISNALAKWSNTLNDRALLVFHFFHDIYDQGEKDILRSLRKAHRSDLSHRLSIVIVSNREIHRWRLYPESDLDERHVAFFEC